MNGIELFNLAPYGALVTFTDGTKRPPAAHVKKVSAWENRNGSGYFVEATPSDKYSGSRFTLRVHTSDHFVANKIAMVDSPYNYEVTPPAPGTILAYSTYSERLEIAHIWKDEAEARAWFARNRYEPHKYGRKHLIIAPDGSRQIFQFAEEIAADRGTIDKLLEKAQ